MKTIACYWTGHDFTRLETNVYGNLPWTVTQHCRKCGEIVCKEMVFIKSTSSV